MLSIFTWISSAVHVSRWAVRSEELAAAIRVHIPSFEIDYDIDPVRQAIADSWPDSMDDTAARQEWGWEPAYDLPAVAADMIEKLSARLSADRKEP